MILGRMSIALAGAVLLAAAAPAAQSDGHSGAATKPPPPRAAARSARADWIFQDCLKRYKDHAGCRYLAYHKRR